MANKMKIRAFTGEDNVCVVKALISHPMETGQRKDKRTGDTIPAHFITEVKVEHNGTPVLTCLWGAVVSQNPYLSFDISGAKAGDTVKISWVDNLGESATGEATVS